MIKKFFSLLFHYFYDNPIDAFMSLVILIFVIVDALNTDVIYIDCMCYINNGTINISNLLQ